MNGWWFTVDWRGINDRTPEFSVGGRKVKYFISVKQ